MFSICDNGYNKLWREWTALWVSNIKLVINKYNGDGIKYQSKKDDWKTFDKDNLTIDLNV